MLPAILNRPHAPTPESAQVYPTARLFLLTLPDYYPDIPPPVVTFRMTIDRSTLLRYIFCARTPIARSLKCADLLLSTIS